MWSTGLRIGDALRFGPQHIRDDKISMRTGKTGWLLDGLPVSVDLRRALDAAPTPHLTYLATAHGRTRSAKAAYTWFSDAAKAAGLPAGFTTAHGLRKGVLTALADAGGSEKQMQAVSGITSPRVLQGYIRAADQQRLAESAMKLIDRGENGTESGPPSKIVGQKKP